MLRLGRRGFLGLTLAAGSIPLLGACSSGSDAPQITQDEVQQLQDSFAHKSFQAMRTRDRQLIKTVETGELLQRDLDTMDLADRLKLPKTAQEFTLPNSRGYPVAGSGDQQQLVTVSDYSNAPQNWQNLGLYQRTSPDAAWLRAFSAGMYAADVPDWSTDKPLTTVDPSDDEYAAEPQEIPGIVAAALQHPNGADGRRFAASDVLQRYADDLAANNQKAASMGPVTRSYHPGRLLIAVATDGGYLALGTLTFTQTVTAKPGSSVTFSPNSDQHKVYPDKYRVATASYSGMIAVQVPTAGKLTLVAGEERQTGLAVK
ncbi:hypothetical protein FOE78_20935 [Microlunatus elymi]|uniref:DUF8094 domain-containing protein n=1 Tax=Microlunatus elymi TaxID=2596828 RepID=A0A516Q3N4_9ACTN|nr:hypothetical protein [Microlunatus elymi]QDP98036.1 hypothetical protein FOE78_20935 [Microlunatus elymi]